MISSHMQLLYGCNWFVAFEAIDYLAEFDYDQKWPIFFFWHNFAQSIIHLDYLYCTKKYSEAFRYYLEPIKLLSLEMKEKNLFLTTFNQLRVNYTLTFPLLKCYSSLLKKKRLYDYCIKTEAYHTLNYEPWKIKLVFMCYVKVTSSNVYMYYRIQPKIAKKTIYIKTDSSYMLKNTTEAYLMIPKGYYLYLTYDWDVKGGNIQSDYLGLFIYKENLLKNNKCYTVDQLGLKYFWLVKDQLSKDRYFKRNGLSLMNYINCPLSVDDLIQNKISPEWFNKKSMQIGNGEDEYTCSEVDASPNRNRAGTNGLRSKSIAIPSAGLISGKGMVVNNKSRHRLPDINGKYAAYTAELEDDSSDGSSEADDFNLAAHMTMYSRGIGF